MVHADSSTFSPASSKAETYTQILQRAQALFDGQRNWVCNLANASSLLYHGLLSLPGPASAVNWCGFYVRDPQRPSQLILGPFQGNVACQTIAVGQGVCGAAAATARTQLVPNVDAFPGHIACDAASRSEIVVPVMRGGTVVAIIDVDCAELDGFDDEDRVYLERLAVLIAASSDFPA